MWYIVKEEGSHLKRFLELLTKLIFTGIVVSAPIAAIAQDPVNIPDKPITSAYANTTTQQKLLQMGVGAVSGGDVTPKLNDIAMGSPIGFDNHAVDFARHEVLPLLTMFGSCPAWKIKLPCMCMKLKSIIPVIFEAEPMREYRVPTLQKIEISEHPFESYYVPTAMNMVFKAGIDSALGIMKGVAVKALRHLQTRFPGDGEGEDQTEVGADLAMQELQNWKSNPQAYPTPDRYRGDIDVGGERTAIGRLIGDPLRSTFRGFPLPGPVITISYGGFATIKLNMNIMSYDVHNYKRPLGPYVYGADGLGYFQFRERDMTYALGSDYAAAMAYLEVNPLACAGQDMLTGYAPADLLSPLTYPQSAPAKACLKGGLGSLVPMTVFTQAPHKAAAGIIAAKRILVAALKYFPANFYKVREGEDKFSYARGDGLEGGECKDLEQVANSFSAEAIAEGHPPMPISILHWMKVNGCNYDKYGPNARGALGTKPFVFPPGCPAQYQG